MQFTDEWLVPSIETLLSDEAVKALREEEGPAASLWELLVERKLASDAQILDAIASRFRFQVADLAKPDPKLVATVPEQVARRFNVVPVSQTDSYLEVATANPFDIDAEKMLAFATGREVRMLLGSPSKIREKLDELYRIDGVLRQLMKIPRSAGLPRVSRIKIMSGLDIADRLRPQDGRARVSVNGEAVDLRVSTLPASLGEKVVIRILSQRATVLSLDALGMHTDEQQAIRRLLSHKEGIILVTGPTGSGKTTTLYSALRAVQGTGVNIVTVEDPVEYRLGENVVQVQVNEKAGLTFAAALRSILRQDPDVVLVGEIRDKETAQIALQASLTGHLVLSTLHTNDAPNTVTRLVDIGMESYKIAPALRGIVAQRLMRRLCKKCRVQATEPVSERLHRFVPPGITLYQGVGCSDCSMTGYRGRFSIVEVLTMNPDLERRIADGASAEKIAEAARRAGMRSLWGSGLRHVLAGESTLEELLQCNDVH